MPEREPGIVNSSKTFCQITAPADTWRLRACGSQEETRNHHTCDKAPAGIADHNSVC